MQATLATIVERFQNLDDTIDERTQSREYLQLVRQAFRIWDGASTEEKRRYVVNVITNAAGTRLCSEDVIRLFLDWLNLYHESHFSVIRTIHAQPDVSRFEIWDSIYGGAAQGGFSRGRPFQTAYPRPEHRWRYPAGKRNESVRPISADAEEAAEDCGIDDNGVCV